MQETKLLVNEIYKSYQGEGINAGTPCVFLRLAYCDLKCSWCDTPYTWDWQKYDVKKEAHPMNNDDVCDKIMSFDVNHVVITGGEPLLQQPQITYLIEHMKKYCANNIGNEVKRNFYFEVETNGTHFPFFSMRHFVDQFNVSPKTSNSGNTHVDLKKIYSETIPKWNQLEDGKVWFKFVVDKEEDIKELDENFFGMIDAHKIILMPQGRTAEELKAKEEWLKPYCKSKNYWFSTRQHILEFGNKRGV